jgi:hypothetical protein
MHTDGRCAYGIHDEECLHLKTLASFLSKH